MALTASDLDDIEVVHQVPLGYEALPAAISQLREAAAVIRECVHAVPDDITGDCDLLEIVMDITLVTERAQDHLNRTNTRTAAGATR